MQKQFLHVILSTVCAYARVYFLMSLIPIRQVSLKIGTQFQLTQKLN